MDYFVLHRFCAFFLFLVTVSLGYAANDATYGRDVKTGNYIIKFPDKDWDEIEVTHSDKTCMARWYRGQPFENSSWVEAMNSSVVVLSGCYNLTLTLKQNYMGDRPLTEESHASYICIPEEKRREEPVPLGPAKPTVDGHQDDRGIAIAVVIGVLITITPIILAYIIYKFGCGWIVKLRDNCSCRETDEYEMTFHTQDKIKGQSVV